MASKHVTTKHGTGKGEREKGTGKGRLEDGCLPMAHTSVRHVGDWTTDFDGQWAKVLKPTRSMVGPSPDSRGDGVRSDLKAEEVYSGLKR